MSSLTRPTSYAQTAGGGQEPPLLALHRLVEEAQGSAPESRKAWAVRINQSFRAMAHSGVPREAADFITRELEQNRLANLVDPEGLTCRAAAVEALLDLGYPYALEVAPEDLEHLRQVRRGAVVGRWAWLILGLVGLGLLGTRWLLSH